MVIDSDLRTVLVNSTPSRNLVSVDSRCYALAPSVPQTLGLQAVSGVANCTITFRNAYI